MSHIQSNVISKKLENGIAIYTISRLIPEEKSDALNGTYVKRSQIKCIIDHNADVYTEEGELLLRFRKNVLPAHHIQEAYDAIIGFARNTTLARGAASGSQVKHVSSNKRIASNIMGYFDQWTLLHRHMFKTMGVQSPLFPVRATRFTADHPEEWNRVIPLIQDIDALYKKLVPQCYRIQRALANQTAYVIPNTSFSTITTNLNLVTAIHKDKGNIRFTGIQTKKGSPKNSFGNLVVIEKGKYTGGYTCYPEYGIGVDVRSGDFLAMDVHRYHGNLPIKQVTPNAERLSIVCYLRHYIWERTQGTTPQDVAHSMQKTKELIAKYYERKKAGAIK